LPNEMRREPFMNSAMREAMMAHPAAAMPIAYKMNVASRAALRSFSPL
jgi:hypothetical protein